MSIHQIRFLSKKYKAYHINCGKCQTYILTYHKFGSGNSIIRLYYYCIQAPQNLVEKLKGNELRNLVCPSCGEVLGVTDNQKGKQVFRMRKGLFHRQLLK